MRYQKLSRKGGNRRVLSPPPIASKKHYQGTLPQTALAPDGAGAGVVVETDSASLSVFLEKPLKNPGRVRLANVPRDSIPAAFTVAIPLFAGASVGESARGCSGSTEDVTETRFASAVALSDSAPFDGGGVVVIRSSDVYAR